MAPLTLVTRASALGDPTRVRMLMQLSRPLCVGQLARSAGVTSSVASYHVRLMRLAGLVVTERCGRTTVVRRIEPHWAAVVQMFVA